ncbi:MAG: preprotein translocase subunit YajC [Sedimentisphaerales bacterium]|jgi:preprotein translocase subunit YajC|nr:preprotein translocase subunit YajC [Planctomycetota bacterium]MDY0356459.1 preprotein translocase subunit YajC [Sedimentisphaerales bacterium]NLT77978.1 preprotein translocase subunit YajC [Planctomycetota bacterium]
MANVWIIAQADGDQAPVRIGSEPVGGGEEGTAVVQDPGGDATAPAPERQVSPLMQFLPLILIFVLMYLFLMRAPRKQQQKQKQMVQSLNKNDRVRTIGGIFGTVVEVRGDEVVLKIDESNNTKIRVSTSAISKNLSQEGKD